MSRVFTGDSANYLRVVESTTFTPPFAVGVFVKPNSAGYTEYASTGTACGFFDAAINTHQYSITLTDGDDGTAVWAGRGRPRLAGTADPNIYSNANDVSADEWTGLILESSSDGLDFTMYVGSQANSFSSATQTWTPDYQFDSFIVGTSNWVAGPDGAYNGKIARVAVWDNLSAALTSGEVTNWFAGTVPQQSKLIGWYPMDTGSVGSETNDATGMGTLTETGTVAYSTDNPFGPIITDFGDENHQWGETGLIITGTGFGS